MFEMLIEGVPLKEYEKKVGKTFLSYLALFEEYHNDGSYSQIEVPLINC